MWMAAQIIWLWETLMGDFKSEYREIVEISSKCLEEAHKITYGIFIK